MDRDDDIGLVRRFLALHQTRADELAPAVYRQPAADYTSAEHLERERATLFARAPLLAGLSADIPEAGDYLTLSGAGAPVVIVRGDDGVARAMANTCRHRGARLGDVGRQPGQQGQAAEQRRPLPLEMVDRDVVGRRLAVHRRRQLVGPRLVQGEEAPHEGDVVVAVHRRISGRRR